MKKPSWMMIILVGILFVGALAGGWFFIPTCNVTQRRIQAGLVARNEKRVKQLQTLQAALDLYYQNNHRYPLDEGDKVFVTNQPTTDLNKKLQGEYLPNLVGESKGESTPVDANWPDYLYWQVDARTYYLFAKLEKDPTAAVVTTRPLPPDNKNVGISYSLMLGSNTLEYNYWLTNLTPSGSSAVTPVPKASTKPTPVPTPTPVVQPPQGGKPSKDTPGKAKGR